MGLASRASSAVGLKGEGERDEQIQAVWDRENRQALSDLLVRVTDGSGDDW